jgi:hypothetical protein
VQLGVIWVLDVFLKRRYYTYCNNIPIRRAGSECNIGSITIESISMEKLLAHIFEIGKTKFLPQGLIDSFQLGCFIVFGSFKLSRKYFSRFREMEVSLSGRHFAISSKTSQKLYMS